jgi:hypothetical protein
MHRDQRGHHVGIIMEDQRVRLAGLSGQAAQHLIQPGIWGGTVHAALVYPPDQLHERRGFAELAERRAGERVCTGKPDILVSGTRHRVRHEPAHALELRAGDIVRQETISLDVHLADQCIQRPIIDFRQLQGRMFRQVQGHVSFPINAAACSTRSCMSRRHSNHRAIATPRLEPAIRHGSPRPFARGPFAHAATAPSRQPTRRCVSMHRKTAR